jgi:hypothetical protein
MSSVGIIEFTDPALREHTFVLGIAPDTPDRAVAAVRGVPGLDVSRLTIDMTSAAVRDAVRSDRAETRAPPTKRPYTRHPPVLIHHSGQCGRVSPNRTYPEGN